MALIRKLRNRLTRKSHADIARELGVRVGKGCCILADPYVCFGSEPWLVELGTHVEVTDGCRFITHDGAVWVLRTTPELKDVDKFGKITVGNNVFIGLNSTILPGVTVGDNCIIGACSLVNKDIPSGEVWAGVPARRICTVEEYKEKVMPTLEHTKGLSAEEKKEFLRQKYPDWF